METIYIKNFGAIPNDKCSDQKAFNDAAAYINKRKGNVKLIIGEGTYLVGPPYNYKSSYKNLPLSQQWDVLALTNCNNVIIEGQGMPSIKFLDNIPFGCVPYRSDKKDSSVHIGSLFRFISCNNVSMRDINAHGNNTNFRLLHNWGVGANPYEREHEGLFILNCKDVTVQNSNFNYFGRDGLMILEDQDKQPVQRLRFTDCNFNYNGRDGVSWCGGADVSFYNCNFNYNASGKIVTNPGSGAAIFSYDAPSEPMGIKITNCTFTDTLPGKRVFRNNYMVSIQGRYMRFNNCTFTSFIVPSLYTEIRKKDKNDHPENTFFRNCVFNANFKKASTWDKWAFLVSHSHFIDCTFNSSGVADFKGILGQGEKNIYQQKNKFIKL